MRAQIGEYVNEIFSFSVMILMAIALVAGQADATLHDVARADANISAERTGSTPFLNASVFMDTDLAALSLHIDMVLAEVAEPLPVDDTTGAPGEMIGIKSQSEQ